MRAYMLSYCIHECTHRVRMKRADEHIPVIDGDGTFYNAECKFWRHIALKWMNGRAGWFVSQTREIVVLSAKTNVRKIFTFDNLTNTLNYSFACLM